MRDSVLLNIAFLCSFIGILILVLVSDNLEAEKKQIRDIGCGSTGEYVTIIGTVKRIIRTNGYVVVDISQESVVRAIVFGNLSINLKKNSIVEVTGRVNEHMGKAEVIVDEIKVAN